MRDSIRILVMDASYRKALGTIRALGMVPGIHVEVADRRSKANLTRYSQGFASRYCQGRHFYTDPALDLLRFKDDLERILAKRQIDVLLPLSIKTVMAILHFESSFRSIAAIPYGSHASMSTANDKAALHEIASGLDVPVPRTCVVSSVQESRSRGEQLPLVLKAARGAGSDAVWFIDHVDDWSSAELALMRRRMLRPEGESFFSSDRLLLQEFVPGDIHDVCLLADHGKIRALMTHKRVATGSIRGGPGVANVTTRVPVLREYAERIVGSLGYHGVAQIEFKKDSRDGAFRLLEMNGKFWGSVALSVAAGINFPLLAVRLAMGETIEDHFEYREDLGYRWMSEIILAWLKERKEGRSLRDLLRYPSETMESSWQWRDPVPSLQRVAETAFRAARLVLKQ